jgi:hypothetical protein
MRTIIRGTVLLVSVYLIFSTTAGAQSGNGNKQTPASLNLGITYTAERAQIAPGACNCFWLQGGTMDAAVTWRKGFGLVASISGDHASEVSPGVDVNKITFLGGERYTYNTWTKFAGSPKKRNVQLFGEWLLGDVHAFNGTFPTGAGVTSSADAFAMQAGGGADVFLSKSFGIRVVQVDYLRTKLPNGYSNSQNDLRVGAGVVYHTTPFHLHNDK